MLLFIIVTLFIAIVVAMVLYFIRRDRGEKEPIGALWLALGFGFMGIFPAVLLESHFVPDFEHVASLGTAFTAAMAVGLIEELAKFGPLALYIYRKRYFNEYTDGVIYFAIAGFGFGLPENIMYTLQYGAGTGLSRIILTPLFHAAISGLLGSALIRMKLGKLSMSGLLITCLAGIMVHGMYDFGIISESPVLMLLSLMIAAAVAAGLFLLYHSAQQSDKMSGLSAVGNNSFCRNCGLANPQHKLYCSRCGARA